VNQTKSLPKKINKKNSVISYSLVNRKALEVPNPAYTCATSGKIVINIVVSETGKVLNANYNKSSSTTSNECLIDAALDYAKRANFSTYSEKKEQLGSITYNFPGQL
jgi:outer membrane biosynthesis protein TonB